MDKKLKIILIPVVAVLILGFALGLLTNIMTRGRVGCTEMYCGCDQVPGKGELPCNHCSSDTQIFYLVFIDVARECPATEIIICQDGINTETRYDIDYSSCKIAFR